MIRVEKDSSHIKTQLNIWRNCVIERQNIF